MSEEEKSEEQTESDQDLKQEESEKSEKVTKKSKKNASNKSTPSKNQNDFSKSGTSEIKHLRQTVEELKTEMKELADQFSKHKRFCAEKFNKFDKQGVSSDTNDQDEKIFKTIRSIKKEVKNETANDSTAGVTASETPKREFHLKKDKEIKTDKNIRLVPRDFAAFDSEIDGNREEFIQAVKEMCTQRDFRVRIPYADRFDRNGFLQLTFMCSMSTFFHRKE